MRMIISTVCLLAFSLANIDVMDERVDIPELLTSSSKESQARTDGNGLIAYLSDTLSGPVINEDPDQPITRHTKGTVDTPSDGEQVDTDIPDKTKIEPHSLGSKISHATEKDSGNISGGESEKGSVEIKKHLIGSLPADDKSVRSRVHKINETAGDQNTKPLHGFLMASTPDTHKDGKASEQKSISPRTERGGSKSRARQPSQKPADHGAKVSRHSPALLQRAEGTETATDSVEKLVAIAEDEVKESEDAAKKASIEISDTEDSLAEVKAHSQDIKTEVADASQELEIAQDKLKKAALELHETEMQSQSNLEAINQVESELLNTEKISAESKELLQSAEDKLKNVATDSEKLVMDHLPLVHEPAESPTEVSAPHSPPHKPSETDLLEDSRLDLTQNYDESEAAELDEADDYSAEIDEDRIPILQDHEVCDEPLIAPISFIQDELQRAATITPTDSKIVDIARAAEAADDNDIIDEDFDSMVEELKREDSNSPGNSK